MIFFCSKNDVDIKNIEFSMIKRTKSLMYLRSMQWFLQLHTCKWFFLHEKNLIQTMPTSFSCHGNDTIFILARSFISNQYLSFFDVSPRHPSDENLVPIIEWEHLNSHRLHFIKIMREPNYREGNCDEFIKSGHACPIRVTSMKSSQHQINGTGMIRVLPHTSAGISIENIKLEPCAHWVHLM